MIDIETMQHKSTNKRDLNPTWIEEIVAIELTFCWPLSFNTFSWRLHYHYHCLHRSQNHWGIHVTFFLIIKIWWDVMIMMNLYRWTILSWIFCGIIINEIGNCFLHIHCLVLNTNNDVSFINYFNELSFRNVKLYLNVRIAKMNMLKRRGCRDKKIHIATTNSTPTPEEEEYQ